MLSLAAIATLFNSVEVTPLIFILKAEVLPPNNFTEDNLNCWSFSFTILKDCVTDPLVVKTVSNFKESVLMRSLASGLVIKESFLQELVDTININPAINKKKKFFIKTNLQ